MKIWDSFKKLIEYLKPFFMAFFTWIRTHKPGEDEVFDPTKVKVQEDVKRNLLKPLQHKRYLTMYYVADLFFGTLPLMDSDEQEIAKVTKQSRNRLDMEGTGKLPDGRVLNVSKYVEGEWRYSVMGEASPYGVGIRGKSLEIFKSLAANIGQISEFSMFDKKVVIPSLRGYVLPNGLLHNGEFFIHDTGGAMQKCPYEKGLFRSGTKKSNSGQLDVFIYYSDLYKELSADQKWEDFASVIVMPRDTSSSKGIQETVNLLVDAGLNVDGVLGPISVLGIKKLQRGFGFSEEELTGKWDSETRDLAERSLNNW